MTNLNINNSTSEANLNINHSTNEEYGQNIISNEEALNETMVGALKQTTEDDQVFNTKNLDVNITTPETDMDVDFNYSSELIQDDAEDTDFAY